MIAINQFRAALATMRARFGSRQIFYGLPVPQKIKKDQISRSSLFSNQVWRPSNFIELKTSLGGHCVEQVRNNIRRPFYRPSERLRRKLSYENRLKTPSGRAILMRRILKGRFTLSH